jgi:hypothetical protein
MILAMLAIGGAVAFFALRRPVDQKAAFASQAQEPVTTRPSATATPPVPTAPAVSPDSGGGLVFEEVKDTPQAKGPAARPAHRPTWRPPAVAAAKPAPSAKPQVMPAAAAPPKSGFVPPPVTNPGF